MFIRFEIDRKHHKSGRKSGIFVLSYELAEDQELEHYQRQHIKDLLAYFKKELPIPNYFASRTQRNAISWLKAEETDMVSKFYELKTILEEYGQHVLVTKEKFVGRILYDDKYQVIALT